MTQIESSRDAVHVIGAGLAGSEAAWQVAQAGVPVVLHEMRPDRMTEAHRTDGLAELVCSNSFRSDDAANNAVGLLHAEMRRLGSLIMRSADANQIPAGGALAVDRDGFSAAVTKALTDHPRIGIRRGEIGGLPPADWHNVIVATGPLTSAPLADAIRALTDETDFAQAVTQRAPESDVTQRLLRLAGRVFRRGRLDILADDGRHWRVGAGQRPAATIRVRDARVLRHILRNPSLHFGEAYMDGLWEPVGSLMEVLEVGMCFLDQLGQLPAVKAMQRFKRRFIETNDATRAKRNIHHHYDLDAALYREFLDADMQYSCAYWREGVSMGA